MSKLKIILTMAIAVFCFTALHAQSSKAKTKKPTADSVVYQCPMKCEGDKTYAHAGKCPKCNMDLKAVSKSIASVKYQCPMKCEGDKVYDKAGKCPKCNMDLAKLEGKTDSTDHKGHNHN